MPLRSWVYQTRITGLPMGLGYCKNEVMSDGFDEARGVLVLLEAKGPGYATFVREGKYWDFFDGLDSMLHQLKNQDEASGGLPIEWKFAEETAAGAFTNELLRQ